MCIRDRVYSYDALDLPAQRGRRVAIDFNGRQRIGFVDSVEEIARRYGLRSGAVKTRLHRTRRKLRDYLQKEGYVL